MPLIVQLLMTGTIVSPWPPSTIARTSLTRHAGLPGEEQLEARRVEDAGHADDLLAAKPVTLLELVDHGVERVRDDDHERVRAVLLQVLGDVADDLQVHRQRSSRDMPGLRGTPAVMMTTSAPAQSAQFERAGDLRVVAEDGAVLLEVERLALGDAFLLGDVEEDDVAELVARARARPARRRCCRRQ